MRIVIAPDSFKGSLSAIAVCNTIETAICKVIPEAKIKKIPLSDGGEGMVAALIKEREGNLVSLSVHDPLGRSIQAQYGIVDNQTAVIEMAAASGLTLIEESERNPLKTSTFGTGQMIYDAVVRRGMKKVILGLGGSATNDGGIGLAAALGVRFIDEGDHLVEPNASNLAKIEEFDFSLVDPDFFDVDFLIASDVSNPLCGENGATVIYGPQKGATVAMINELDQGLKHLCVLFEEKTKQLFMHTPGIGAAGGTALPLLALFGARIQSGLEIILDAVDFDNQIRGADLIITGEGKTDCQSPMGKVVSGVGKRAKKLGIPAVIISGALEPGYEVLYSQGIVAAFAAGNNSLGLEWQMKNATMLLENQVENLMRFGLQCGIKIKD